MSKITTALFLTLFLEAPISFGVTLLPEECKSILQSLQHAPHVDTVEVAFHPVLENSDSEDNPRERINAAINRLKHSGVEGKEALRLLGLAAGKFLVARYRTENVVALADRAWDFLWVVRSELDVTDLLSAFRHPKPEEALDPLFKKWAITANELREKQFLEAEASRKLSEGSRKEAEEARRAVLEFLNHQLWHDGSLFGLPLLPRPTFSAGYTDPGFATAAHFELAGLKWIQKQGEQFYAVDSQVMELGEMFRVNGKYGNADCISVSKTGTDYAINIREFKLGSRNVTRGLDQIRDTLIRLLSLFPDLPIGQLEVLTPDDQIEVKLQAIWVANREFVVTHRLIPYER